MDEYFARYIHTYNIYNIYIYIYVKSVPDIPNPRVYEPTVYDIEFFSGTDRLPLTRLSVEKLKSNKKLLLVFAALLLPSLAPVDFLSPEN